MSEQDISDFRKVRIGINFVQDLCECLGRLEIKIPKGLNMNSPVRSAKLRETLFSQP
jgi:hypothetical protein